jgi:CheY-like chemotaxis protein
MGDAAQLQQVLLNLVVNARDAMPDGGTLRLSLRPEPASADHPSSAVLEVADTGQGIEPGIREQIFEPFFTTKPRGKGTGLGLAVVQGVVRSMQGTIELESTSGQGTRFIIRLPGIAAPAQPVKLVPEPAPTELALPERSQAVVAEPDPFVRSLMTTALRSLGLTPTEVDTLSQAGDEVRRLLPSVRVAIIDAATREQSPNDPVGVLRAIDPHVGVILLVGEQSAAGAEAGGAGVRVLRRPFRMQALRQAIEELDSWFAKEP